MGFTFNMVGAAITFLFSAWALAQPQKFARILSLTPYKSKGITEIRSTYGGWMMGLSGFTLYNQAYPLFTCLGVGWILTAIVRSISMVLIEKKITNSEIKVIVLEVVIGAFLLFPN